MAWSFRNPPILHFPDLDTLRLALTSGAVPASVAQTAVKAGLDGEGRLWLEPAAALPRQAQAELARLGAKKVKQSPVALGDEVDCWPQLFPLQRAGDVPAESRSAPVLFDVPASQLAELASEMLRLGNDRQSFRWIEADGEPRALLRVVGPPYYSLLRALERPETAAAPRAYVERAPRVWVQLGWSHPLAEQLQPPAGKLLLLRPPRQWTYGEDAPFRDIYEVLEFTLPEPRAAWPEAELKHRIRVPLRLARGGPAEAAELWVLRDRAFEQLDTLVAGADDQLLQQLSFAVAEKDGQTTIVLRVRPSKSPPVLVLDAVGFRPYLKLPNLFLPCGARLHPPLRRDAVRKLLADDPAVLTWLWPLPENAFRPEGLSDRVFRPLSDWIDYVLDHEREALQAWIQSAQFDFESFVCADDQREKPDKERPAARRRDQPARSPAEPAGGRTPALPQAPVTDKPLRLEEESLDKPTPFAPVEPSVLQRRLRELEDDFLGQQGPLDSPRRRVLWPELAAVHTALSHAAEAGACWLHALWGEDVAPAAWTLGWLRAEAGALRVRPGKAGERPWALRSGSAPGGGQEIKGEDLDQLLALADPTPADVRALSAYLLWAARQHPPPAALAERLNSVRTFLEKHESHLPVRAAWLAWLSVVQLTQGDVLALARARDRLLERLFATGLRPDQDLPGFLRLSGPSNSERDRAVPQLLLRLYDLAGRWVDRHKNPATEGAETTPAYVALLFAFGLACAGEARASQELLDRAAALVADHDLVKGEKDDAHPLLLQAFTYRVQQVLEGKPHRGPLPTDQIEYLEHMERQQRYVVDRLRDRSRILEPDQKLDPYRHWTARPTSLDGTLARLPDIADREQLADCLRRLVAEGGRKEQEPSERVRILSAALDQAPRVGEELSLSILQQVAPAFDALLPPPSPLDLERLAGLLERGLFVAAHFDRAEDVQALMGRFSQLLQSHRGPQVARSLDALTGQSFRGLRKLGLRAEIDRLLGEMTDLILKSYGQRALGDFLALAASGDSDWQAALRTLLSVAAGWFYFGRDAQAEPVLTAARTALYRGNLHYRERTLLACRYVTTLGQAPVALAQEKLEELFHHLKGIRDPQTTNSHYSLSQLEVIEAVVWAVVGDDATLGSDARRWLDEDELLVRRRIHADLRALMQQSTS